MRGTAVAAARTGGASASRGGVCPRRWRIQDTRAGHCADRAGTSGIGASVGEPDAPRRCSGGPGQAGCLRIGASAREPNAPRSCSRGPGQAGRPGVGARGLDAPWRCDGDPGQAGRPRVGAGAGRLDAPRSRDGGPRRGGPSKTCAEPRRREPLCRSGDAPARRTGRRPMAGAPRHRDVRGGDRGGRVSLLPTERVACA